jgi:hypothetical protein
MSYFSVTLTFDKPIPKTSIKKLKKEIYDKIFRVEWLIKSIYFSKSDISCKGDKSFIKFRSDYDNSEKTLTPKITTALKGSAWSRLYLDDSLKAIKLDVDVKKTKKTKKKGGPKKSSKKKEKDPYKATSKIEKDYLQICSKAEKDKRLNKDLRNFDCETTIYNYNTGKSTKSDLRFYINWYKKGIKRGELDWDAYNTYHDDKKKKHKKKGGSKKMSSKEFKEFLQGKEKEYENDRQKCSRTCSKIKTNYAQNKDKLNKKTKCYATCEKKRLTSIQTIHKQYPKEFKLYLNNL